MTTKREIRNTVEQYEPIRTGELIDELLTCSDSHCGRPSCDHAEEIRQKVSDMVDQNELQMTVGWELTTP